MSVFDERLIDGQTNQVVFQLTVFENGVSFGNVTQVNHFSMFLVSKGKGKVMRDTAEFEFEGACLICLSLYQPFMIKPEDEVEGVMINFHPSFFCLFKHRNEVSCNGVLFNNLYDTPVVSLTAFDSESLQIIATEMQREMRQRNTPDEDIILSYLKVFLINASRTKREQQEGELQRKQRTDPMVAQLRDAIEQHFRTLHSPADYAKLLFMSTQALNNLAKRYFDKTLISLIADRLITEAKRELYLTAKPVKQIAFEMGYSDEFYFSRFFKKQTGVSPAYFRETVGFNKIMESQMIK